jgi:epoxyqueuosine reductase
MQPQLLLPGARTAIVLSMDYCWPAPTDPGGLTGRVARYAWGRDYHNLIGKRLRKFTRALSEHLPGIRTYAGVDSRPLQERAWAARGGLGFPGKNCCSIIPASSSYHFLAVVLTDREFPSDSPMPDHCGTCTRCLDHCPTNAFLGPGQLDARRCISYLTIEHDGPIPEPLRPKMGRWVFGCDDCQEVCPHNGQPMSQESDFEARVGNAWLDLPWILDVGDEELVERFRGSPIRRACPIRIRRNAAVVLGNLGDDSARPVLLKAANHTSAVVREHAAWALDRL